MSAPDDVVHQFARQASVELVGSLASHGLGILLDGPYGPESHVGLFHLVDVDRHRLARHELAQPLGRRLHHLLKSCALAARERQSGQGDKGVASAAFEPRVSRQDIVLSLLRAVEKLVCGVVEAMYEVVSRYALLALLLEDGCEGGGIAFRGRCGKDDALSLLDRQFEVARHVEVLSRGVSALLLLGIFQVAIPVGVEDKRGFLRELHI